jgi:hypothetical protein
MKLIESIGTYCPWHIPYVLTIPSNSVTDRSGLFASVL